MSTKIEPRDLVLVPLGPDRKPHPAVVLVVTPAGAIVHIAGTGTRRDLPHVLVAANSRDAKAMGFYKNTHFYKSGLGREPLKDIVRMRGRCPPQLYKTLLEFIGADVVARFGD